MSTFSTADTQYNAHLQHCWHTVQCAPSALLTPTPSWVTPPTSCSLHALFQNPSNIHLSPCSQITVFPDFAPSKFCKAFVCPRSAQIFQKSRCHIRIPGPTAQKSVARVCAPHVSSILAGPSHHSLLRHIRVKRNLIYNSCFKASR